MKKFLFIALTAALLASCQNNPSDSDNNQNTPPQNQTVTLQSRLQSAEPGTTIDLESEKLSVTDNGSYTIDKALTIKNGDLKNATFTVKATGVKFEKMKNISNINVAAEVGDGDFSVVNCNEIDIINVNGGGANSIHIENTTVLKLIVQKKDVRIVLKNNDTTSVKNTLIFADCKLDAETGSSFENVIINPGVTKLELAGNVVIEKIAAQESSSATISITATVKINSADSIIKANLKNEDGSAADTSEIKDATLTDAEKEELEKNIFYSKLDFESSDKEKVTVEKSDNEFVIKNTNAEAFNNNVWNKCIYTKEKLPVESNKNYQISVDLKSNKESLVFLSAKDSKSTSPASGKYFKLGTEYKTYTVETGTIGNKGWIKGEFLVAIGCAEVVYAKNFKINPIDEDALPVACWANNEDDLENMSATGTSNGAKFEFTKDVKDKFQRGSDIILSKNELDCGESYEINFEITSDVDLAEGELGIWTHVGNNITDSTGSDKITLKAGEKTKIDFFVHSFQIKEETFRIPYISFLPNKKCNLTIENIQTTKTTKEEYLSKYPSTSLYFAGHINDKWTVTEKLDSITIPGNGEVYFVLLYADTNLPKVYDPWSSLNLYPIEFKMPNDGSLLIQSQNEDGEDKLYFKNPKSESVVAKFSLTDDCKVDVTYTNPWYYIDVDRSLLPEGATGLKYIFNNNNGIQSNDAYFELTDKSVYCFKFGDSYGYDEYGNLKYQSVVSERTDNPTEKPAEGFIRLYFCSELPETPYAYLWTSGTNLVEVTNEDGTTTYEPEFWNNNDWPGIKMIKFE
ncbi:hypothetical protein [Treponema peruense]|uniref:Lipoprotein n=1 Tax=Treponema peruense TaxID=2787628 RepID=A0A7T3V476_9SPIR|nr:hypothetical protein [Treponema peruense]QQA00297.1 hypothetical protein IWA51_08420 [Treponema peruense]